MGWAGRNLTAGERESIARSLFEVKEVRAGVWLHGLCPLHGDASPSFGYNVAEDVWACNAGCGSGDLVKLSCLLNGLDDKAGFLEFRRKYDPKWTEAGVDPKERQAQIERDRAAAKVAEARPYVAPQNAILSDALFDEISAPLPPGWRDRLFDVRGWTDEVMDLLDIRLQVQGYSKKKQKIFPLQTPDRLCLPVRDAKGALRQIRLYKPFDRNPGDTKIYSWGSGSGHPELYPAPPLWLPGVVYLVEGEPDSTCGRSRGLNSVGQTGKPTHWPTEFTKYFKGRDVVIVPDADKPGHKYAHKAAMQLYGQASRVRILQWPPEMGLQGNQWPDKHGKDLTDWFMDLGRSVEEFLALAEVAPDFVPPEHGAGCSPGGAVPPGSPGEPGTTAADAAAESFTGPKRFFTTGENGRLSFRELLLAQELIERCGPLLYHPQTSAFYRWNDVHFEEWQDEVMKREAVRLLEEETTASRVDASCRIVRALAAMDHGRDLDDREEWICIRNGMLNLSSGELVPHDPDFLASHVLPVRLDPANTPPPERWLKFLGETIQTPEAIAQLQEFMGYSLTRSVVYEKALLLHGPGGDGKSKLCNTWMAMIGEKNCSSVPLGGLDDQFQRVGVYGKLLNVATEIDAEAVRSAMFKAIVSGDSIQAAYKHQNTFTFKPFCKLVYACNELPRILDNSDGPFRRLLPITFKRQFKEGDPDIDVDLQVKLLAELDGIFEWALQGLLRLRNQGRFTDCEETREFIHRMRRYNSPLMAFVQDSCQLAEDSQLESRTAYVAFKTYAGKYGYRAMNKGRFEQEFPEAVRKVLEHETRLQRVRVGDAVSNDNSRPFVFKGVSLKILDTGS
jgi:putative DNA primase/helicase